MDTLDKALIKLNGCCGICIAHNELIMEEGMRYGKYVCYTSLCETCYNKLPVISMEDIVIIDDQVVLVETPFKEGELNEWTI